MDDSSIQIIRTLIAKGQLREAIQEFRNYAMGNQDLLDAAASISLRFQDLKSREISGIISRNESNLERNTIVDSLLKLTRNLANTPYGTQLPGNGISAGGSQLPGNGGEPKAPQVFISYNHKDQEHALKVKNHLEGVGIKVIMDVDNTRIGGSIQTYLEEAVRDTDCTVSIVSQNSLLSSWVGAETMHTFMHEQVMESQKFMACFIDDEFFKPDFLLRMVRQIDVDLGILTKNRDELVQLNIDASNLNSQISRLHELRQNSAQILRRLTDSFSLDIREQVFEQNMKKLVKAIREVAKNEV